MNGQLDPSDYTGMSFWIISAAMVAATGWRRFLQDGPTLLNTGANPNLKLPEKAHL